MLKKVTNSDYVGACRYTGYIPKSIKLTLECGHEQHRKASQGVPVRANCKDCDREPRNAEEAAEAAFHQRLP
jgi:hypothetical protein